MTMIRLTRRDFTRTLCAASAALAAGQAGALCAGAPELGRWRNVAPAVDPAVLDLRMDSCGDQVLNGEETETRYSLRAWVLQSSGKLYGRPSAQAHWRQWKGQRWLVARVPTGGYVDNIWATAAQRDGQQMLHVLIKHESLDSKPSSTSEHWFRFDKRI